MSNLNNYYYKEISYKTKGLQTYDYSISETYYKDGILKMKTDNSIVWIDYKKNYGYTFDVNDKSYSELTLDTSLFPKENGIQIISSMIPSKNNIGDFIYCLSPKVTFKRENKEYLAEHISKVNSLKIKVEERRDTEQGLPISIIEYRSDGINNIKEYNISLDETTDKDIECPKIEEYIKK